MPPRPNSLRMRYSPRQSPAFRSTSASPRERGEPLGEAIVGELASKKAPGVRAQRSPRPHRKRSLGAPQSSSRDEPLRGRAAASRVRKEPLELGREARMPRDDVASIRRLPRCQGTLVRGQDLVETGIGGVCLSISRRQCLPSGGRCRRIGPPFVAPRASAQVPSACSSGRRAASARL